MGAERSAVSSPARASAVCVRCMVVCGTWLLRMCDGCGWGPTNDPMVRDSLCCDCAVTVLCM